MTYRSIATIVTRQDENALTAAMNVAQRFDAHLDINILSTTLFQGTPYYTGTEAVVLAEQMDEAKAELADLEAWVREQMRPEILRWSSAPASMLQSGLTAFMPQALRYNDLVVLALPEAGHKSDMAIVEACVFAAHRPVLMIPDGAEAPSEGGKILLGWNDGDEALMAAQKAMPFLRGADSTDITVIGPQDQDRSDPGGALAQYLTRHGVRSEISVLAKSNPDIGNLISRRADEIGAQMIVAGAYGHSRLREAIFGGATRSLLETARRPLFMAR